MSDRAWRSKARGFVNGAVGGHVRLLRDRELRLHGGLSMDRSPVEENDAIFGRIDFLSWTLGASGQFGRFQFAIGVNRRSGTSDDIAVQNLIDDRRGDHAAQDPHDRRHLFPGVSVLKRER